MPRIRRALSLAVMLCVPLIADVPVDQPPLEEEIEVLGVTPVHGSGLDRHRHAANVQVEKLGAGQGPLTEALRQSFASVQTDDVQNNPWQADLHFRGFTGSPLLGTPRESRSTRMVCD